ncbi:hypothetical protein GGS23DRAFT_604347 [Durotheca rogersii]|uniref:uncharacterized protein n=1 Tax=Durotheca rogersii TaxID=419775 RepID=UPI0022204022|nr:uncharacterized protein GGS23DRAFT_604347 [Durotheca rogersii]KAI5864894.1 hypothetical protein GGS23DRAFT_604347 [Durotheca rogersii]
MSAPSPPRDGDVNRGPSLLAIFWAEVGISTTFVALRFYTRAKTGYIGADDWTILVTLVMNTTTLSLCTVLVHYGLGRHIYYIPVNHLSEMKRWNWVVQPFGILTLPVGKISVVLLLERLVGHTSTRLRWFLWANMALFTASMVASSILNFAQCNPPRALWSDVPGAVCLHPTIQANYATFTCAYSSFLDFVLALVPVTFVWKLRMSTRRKIGLCILLGMGVLSGVCAAIKTVQSSNLSVREDVSWELFSLYAWSSSEISLNIVCACVPTLKPLFDYLTKNKPLRRGSSSGDSRPKGSPPQPLHLHRTKRKPYGHCSALDTIASTRSETAELV